jgi:hypothetical protein
MNHAMEPFSQPDRHRALDEIPGQIFGRVDCWTWLGVYRMFLTGFRNKLAVPMQ